MKKKICVFILCILSAGIFAQTKQELLEKLRKADCFEYETIGICPIESELYKSAEKFFSLCSDKESIKFLNDESSVVKCYAAYFLQKKNIKADWYKILSSEINDYTKITTWALDIGGGWYVGDFLFDCFFNKLSDDEKEKIEIQLIQKKSELYFAEKILLSDKKSEKLYSTEKSWALEGKDTAIYSLAKYQKADDIQLIEKLQDLNVQLFFKACKYNMSDSYKPFLKNYMISIMPEEHFSNEWNDFYKLISDYHDDFSREIFDMAFSDKVNNNIQKYHLRFIFNAIENSTDGFYDEYLKKLWLESDLIQKNTIDYFIEKDKTFAVDAMKKSLENSDDYFSKTEVLEYIIQIMNINEIDLTSYFSNAIQNNGVTTVEVFMNNIDCVQKNSAAIIDAMKKRLENELNPHICLPFYRYLISLKDKNIDDYLIRIFNKNKSKYMKWAMPEFEKLIDSIK